MAVESQDVLEKEKILQVIQSLFFSSPVFMLFERKEYSVKPLKLIPEGLIIQSIGRQDREERILFVKASEKIFEISFDLLGINAGKELLYPRKLIVRNIQELSEESKTYKKLFISKIIREEDIIPNILSENNQLKKIIETYQNDLRNKLSLISVYISDKTDQRLRLLREHKKSIYVPNKLEPECVPEEFVPYDEYFQLMKASVVPKQFISEVCVPLNYKNICYIGYLVAWHTKELDINGFKFAEKIAYSILKDIYYWNLAQEWIDKLEVAYLSTLGLEFYAPNSKNFTKHIKANTTLVFDIYMDKDYIISGRALVSNITPTEKNFQVGLEFIFNDEEQRIEFQNTIESLQTNK